MKPITGTFLLTLAMLAGCTSTPEQQQSGFLRDYSQLQPDPDREGVMLYIDRSTDFRPYTKLMIDPVQVMVVPVPDQPPPPRDVVARIGAQLLDSLQRALATGYQLVNAPGPDVLRVRSAITGLAAAKPEAGALDYVPIKAIYNLGREAAGGGPRVAEMKAELEVLDPGGRRVIAATANRKGEKTLTQGDQITWDSLPPITDYWARNIRMRLDKLRGVPGPGVPTGGGQ
jgi:hypothetical protein